jgi:hypothetical protein
MNAYKIEYAIIILPIPLIYITPFIAKIVNEHFETIKSHLLLQELHGFTQ